MLIPINPEAVTTEYAPLDDGAVYEVMVEKLEISEMPDKNGDDYLRAQYQVITPIEWKGRRIFDGYIGLPGEITPDMDSGQRRTAQDKGVRLGRLLRCFKIEIGPDGLSTEDAVGKIGSITIKNEEYEGKISSRVKEYLQ